MKAPVLQGKSKGKWKLCRFVRPAADICLEIELATSNFKALNPKSLNPKPETRHSHFNFWGLNHATREVGDVILEVNGSPASPSWPWVQLFAFRLLVIEFLLQYWYTVKVAPAPILTTLNPKH